MKGAEASWVSLCLKDIRLFHWISIYLPDPCSVTASTLLNWSVKTWHFLLWLWLKLHQNHLSWVSSILSASQCSSGKTFDYSLAFKSNNIFLLYDHAWSIILSSSHPSRPADSVFCLCGPGGRRLPGVAEGIQPCQHCAQRPRSETRGVLWTTGKGKHTISVVMCIVGLRLYVKCLDENKIPARLKMSSFWELSSL